MGLLSDLRVVSCCFQIFASPSYPTDIGVFPPIFFHFILSMNMTEKPHNSRSRQLQLKTVVEPSLDLSSRTFKFYILKHFILHHVQCTCSVSFWPLLIIESLAYVSQQVLFTHELLVKVVVRACYGAYFVAHIFKNLARNFVSGRPGRRTLKCSRDLHLTARLSNYQCTFT